MSATENYKWMEDWCFHELVNGSGEVIGAVTKEFPFTCYIGGAQEGQYSTLGLAQEQLIKKCKKKHLLK